MSMNNGKKSFEEVAAESMRSLGFDDPNRIRELKAFLEIDQATCRKINQIRDTTDKYIVPILDQIYDHLQQFPSTRKFLPDQATVERLKDVQRSYFNYLMSGNYDSEYVQNVVRVGLAHVRIGLEPEWYMGTYSKYLCSVMASFFEDSKEGSFFSKFKSGSDKEMLTSLQALVKIFFFDMTLTIKSYIGPQMAELEAKKQAADEKAKNLQNLTGRIVVSVNDNAERVQMVAAATEEMSATIKEISKNIQESTQVITKAVKKTEATTQNISNLKASAKNIGKMTKTIRTIAEQTNLLALNATIESARAGEAGKGFAVVANEVKVLSKGTAKATEEITHMILSIQKETETAVGAISELQEIIQKINDIITDIAGAVEEQSVTTDEISRNTAHASTRMVEVAEDIKSCEGITEETYAGNT